MAVSIEQQVASINQNLTRLCDSVDKVVSVMESLEFILRGFRADFSGLSDLARAMRKGVEDLPRTGE